MEVPDFMIGGYFGAEAAQFSPEKQKAGEYFTIDDLLDFSNEDATMTDGFADNVAGSFTDSSTVTVVESCNSSVSGGDHHFSSNIGYRSFGGSQLSGELCVPCDDLAELEWLSNFVEDSFSAEETNLHSLTFLSDTTAVAAAKPETPGSLPSEPYKIEPFFRHETSLPGKARSKRTRASPCDWSSRLLHLPNPADPKPPKKGSATNSDSSGRKCLHCAAEKTPQWRTGPMGPKTLCNACGVRYKSGRLVPEYRPAASPTFVSTKHSNSHRKVLELRRQKEVQRAHHQQNFLSQTSIFGVSNGFDDYLIRHHGGHDFNRMI